MGGRYAEESKTVFKGKTKNKKKLSERAQETIPARLPISTAISDAECGAKDKTLGKKAYVLQPIIVLTEM